MNNLIKGRKSRRNKIMREIYPLEKLKTRNVAIRILAEGVFEDKYGKRNFGRLRKWALIKLLEYQIKDSLKNNLTPPSE